MLYVKQFLPTPVQLHFESLKDNDYVSCKLKLDDDYVKITLVYRAPNSNAKLNKNIIKFITEDIKMEDYSKWIIAGDFNCPNIEWTNESTSSKAKPFERKFYEATIAQETPILSST